jgi:hypothetical protein
MSEQSDNNNKRPRFSIPSASQVYNSTSSPPTINTFQKAFNDNTASELEQNKTFSNVTKQSETVLKRTFSNITTNESTTQTITKTTLETANSSGGTVKKFSNITTTTQTNSSTSSVPSTSTPTYKPPQKSTSLPRPAEPTASKFGPGGSIHVNPCQVISQYYSTNSLKLTQTLAWKPYIEQRTCCPLGIQRHSSRLRSRQNHMCTLPILKISQTLPRLHFPKSSKVTIKLPIKNNSL